jgi:hypothetical protein
MTFDTQTLHIDEKKIFGRRMREKQRRTDFVEER